MTHLTYMDRYMHRAGKALDITPHRDGLKRLFDKLLQKQLTLELNTSTLGDGFAMPSAEILSLYRECGGTRVCLGSDAHAPAKITQHFPATCKLLLDCGFTELTLPTRNETLTYPIPKEIKNV
jgi:histidinol-phosphatase (PHP family)